MFSFVCSKSVAVILLSGSGIATPKRSAPSPGLNFLISSLTLCFISIRLLKLIVLGVVCWIYEYINVQYLSSKIESLPVLLVPVGTSSARMEIKVIFFKYIALLWLLERGYRIIMIFLLTIHD